MAKLNKEEYFMTQAEVAKALGISRNRVYQLEKQALEKVRRRLMARGLGPTPLDGGPEGNWMRQVPIDVEV